MKKSKITSIAVIVSVLTAACMLAYFLINILGRDSDDPSRIGEADYFDDLDIPEIPDTPVKEDKAPAKVRRGYIPIRLGRE